MVIITSPQAKYLSVSDLQCVERPVEFRYGLRQCLQRWVLRSSTLKKEMWMLVKCTHQNLGMQWSPVERDATKRFRSRTHLWLLCTCSKTSWYVLACVRVRNEWHCNLRCRHCELWSYNSCKCQFSCQASAACFLRFMETVWLVSVLAEQWFFVPQKRVVFKQTGCCDMAI